LDLTLVPIRTLVERILSLQPKQRQTLIVAVDGYGGSGKSTLARELGSRLKIATIISTDDFSRPEVSGWDWERMKDQVLDPLNQDKPGKYQRYDWRSGTLAEWHAVPVGGVVIVEGVSSMREELGCYWDLAIWVECSRARRLERGIARDGEAKRSQWEDVWMPEEGAYVLRQRPDHRADVVISGEQPTWVPYKSK
jgi:uridine kinase